MPSQIVPAYFAPDLDNAWSVAPGAIVSMDGLIPLQSGAYGSIGTSTLFNLTGSNIIKGKLFRQIDGSVRLLVFRATDIDEYDSSGTKTNRGTGYTAAAPASSTTWSAAAWGNQIIAVNGPSGDAPQSSTGAGFTALSGSPPKARHVAANVNFVMLADVNDGGSNVYSDMVWWCGLRNTAQWAPLLSYQSGNIRLLDAPGPIRALTAYRDTFIAFKDNAIFVGEYVGPQNAIFSWRLISSKIGCISPDSVAEVDGKLYFLHSSGFFEYDGQSLRNIGLPVFQSFMTTAGYLTGTMTGGGFGSSSSSTVASTTQSFGDDVEGVYWISAPYLSGTNNFNALYSYNCRSGKWGRVKFTTYAGSLSYIPSRFVFGSSADMKDFMTSDTAGRVWMLWNSLTQSTLKTLKYPAASTDTRASITTGLNGSCDGAQKPTKFYWRVLYPSTSPDATMTLSANGYSSEQFAVVQSSYTPAVNTEFDEADLRLNARFINMSATWTLGSTTVLAGIGWGVDGRPR